MPRKPLTSVDATHLNGLEKAVQIAHVVLKALKTNATRATAARAVAARDTFVAHLRADGFDVRQRRGSHGSREGSPNSMSRSRSRSRSRSNRTPPNSRSTSAHNNSRSTSSSGGRRTKRRCRS